MLLCLWGSPLWLLAHYGNTAQLAPASRPMAEAGEGRSWSLGGGADRFSVNRRCGWVREEALEDLHSVGDPVQRCREVRGSLKTLVYVGVVGAEGRAGEGPLRGLWQPASGSWRRSSST
jgi:hypothetical protein